MLVKVMIQFSQKVILTAISEAAFRGTGRIRGHYVLGHWSEHSIDAAVWSWMRR